jgi:spore maturation protein CgeB
VRVIVVDTYYPAFLAAHYAAQPGLEGEPYDKQLRSLLAQSFGTSDAYSRNLRAVGCDAAEIVANCEPLQRAWAAERGFAGSLVRRLRRLFPGRLEGRAALREIALAQIAEFDPDVVYLQDLWLFSTGELERLHADGRLVVGQIASAPPPDRRLRAFDLLTTSFPHYVERFRALGVDAEYFPIAFDEIVLDRLRERGLSGDPAGERPYGLTFVGGLDPCLHSRGVRLLERLASELELEVWGYGADGLSPRSPLRRWYRGQAWGLDMYEVLASSRITLNRHIEAAEGHANNMRLYEATGVGALLATDDGANLDDLFNPGREVVSYNAATDLIEALRRYAADDEARREVAAAGQQRTLRQHTYSKRIAELAAMLEGRLR